VGLVMSNSVENDNGFMLSELLIVCSVMVFVLSAAWLAFTTITNNMDAVTTQTTLSSDTNGVMDKMAREIRQSQEIADGGGVFEKANGDAISFYSNIDAAGAPERIRYFREGTILYRAVDEPTIETDPYNYVEGPAVGVLSGVSTSSGAIFSFYNNGSPAVELFPSFPDTTNIVSGISMVGVSLTANANLQGRVISYTAITKIKIRSMFGSLN